jgi:cobalt-zinc-cadmium efflux system membrane fusion protein
VKFVSVGDLRDRLAVAGPRVWFVTAGFMMACTGSTQPDEHADAHDEHGEQAGAHEHASSWAEVERPRDASLLELPARIVAAAESRARVDTPLRGTVVSVTARVGDRVEVGSPIVEMRIPEVIEAAAIMSGTGKQIGSHKARRTRLEELKAAGLVGAGEVFDVESDLGRLSAERRLALATLAAVGVTSEQRSEVLERGTVVFTSPIAGVVAQIDAVPGDVVEPSANLATILGLAPARIEVISPGALPDLGVGAWTNLEFEGLDGSRIALASTPIATAVEPGLGRTLAWFETADPKLALADGVRGRVQLRSDDPKLLEVPRRSLRLVDGHAWVGRQSASGELEMVEVEVLRSAGSSALIRSEALAVGDRIAIDAATVLLLGRDPEELGGGHQH